MQSFNPNDEHIVQQVLLTMGGIHVELVSHYTVLYLHIKNILVHVKK